MLCLLGVLMSLDRVVSIELWDGSLGFESRQEQAIFLFSKASRPGLGPTQPSIQWVAGFSQRGNLASAWCLPHTFIKCQGSE
jgi:hypothetical protein